MTEDQYKAKMDSITQSLAMVGLMTTDVTDEDLATIEKTLSLAEGVGFLYATTFTFDQQRKNIELQRKSLRAYRAVRTFLEEVIAEA